jgi:hypothetical protein
MSNIKAGFTGELEDRSGVAAVAKRAARNLQREAGAVAATAQDHRLATGTLLLLVGTAAFMAGLMIGGEREKSRPAMRFPW